MSIQITGSVLGGRYKVTGYLREGRMGNLYVARTEDNRRFAVKILDQSLFGNPEAIRRFEREMRVHAKLDHPNCMEMFEAGRTEDGVPWLVVEYFDGELLAEYIDEHESVGIQPAVAIAAQVARAMRAAHEIGIVHRDLSPAVILLGADAKGDINLDQHIAVKVLDFGLAGVVDSAADEDTSLTAVGVRVGAPHYMAPEYIEEFSCDHRADIYALGIVLYEMLAGEPPFVGRPYRVMDMHVSKPAPRISERRPEVPDWLDDLIAKMLCKAPGDRPQSASDVIDIIEQHAGSAQTSTNAAATSAPTAQATQADSAGVDPVLERLKETMVLKVDRRTGGAPPAKHTLLVERISKHSPLVDYGVKMGTRIAVEELGEGLLDPTLLSSAEEVRTYTFQIDGERTVLKLRAALAGVDFIRSAENIQAYYEPISDGPEPMVELWKQSAWAELEKVSLKVLQNAAASSSGVFARLIGGGGPAKPMNHPATLMYGAALIEQGRGDEGFPYVLDFRNNHSSQWPEVYAAIATAYQGLQRMQTGKTDLGIELMTKAYRLAPLAKLRIVVERHSGEPLKTSTWYKKPFPAAYDLMQTDGRPGEPLRNVLGRMDSSQLMLVVLLGGFRGNEAYNDFMLRYVNFARYLSEFVVGVQVCTTVKDRTGDHRPEWFTGEDLAIRAGLPVSILEDYRAFVQREVKPSRIPTVYALNRHGTVLHEGLCTSVDLWNAIGRAGRVRMAQLEGRT